MTPPKTLLIVDDEVSNLESLQRIFQRFVPPQPDAATLDGRSLDSPARPGERELNVLTCSDGREALELLRKQRVDVVLTDLMMPGTSGMDLLKAARKLSPETEVILMTAYGTIEAAVEAMKDGAYDFITKPLKRAHVLRVVGKALERQSLVAENRALRSQLAAAQRRPIVGQSLAMRRTLEVLAQAAPSQATVLLLGESGTGKELLARHLHDLSPRAGRALEGLRVEVGHGGGASVRGVAGAGRRCARGLGGAASDRAWTAPGRPRGLLVRRGRCYNPPP